MKRNLDGIYFRMKREDGYDNVCFSDLTAEEREEVMRERDEAWLRSMCNSLANTIRELGDTFDLVAG